MQQQYLYQPLRNNAQYQRLLSAYRGDETSCSVIGVGENAKVPLLSALLEDCNMPILLVCPNDFTAQKLFSLFEIALGEHCALLPSRNIQLSQKISGGKQTAALRVSALTLLTSEKPCVVIASVDAARAVLLPVKDFAMHMLTIEKSMRIDLHALTESLVKSGYQRVDTVYSTGEFAQRGGILDIYPPGMEGAIRIDFFGDEVDTIKKMDVLSQRSFEELQHVLVPPACEAPLSEEALADLLYKLERTLEKTPQSDAKQRLEAMALELEQGEFTHAHELLSYLDNTKLCSAVDYLPQGGILVLDEPVRLHAHTQDADVELQSRIEELKEKELAPLGWEKQLLPYLVMLQNNKIFHLQMTMLDHSVKDASVRIPLEMQAIPSYYGRMELLVKDLNTKKKNKMAVAMVMRNEKQCKTLHRTFFDRGVECAIMPQWKRELTPGELVITTGNLGAGYELLSERFTAIAEGEIYRIVQSRASAVQQEPTKQTIDYKIGDALVHDIHGIGRYLGLQTIEVDGSPKDFMTLEYRDGDKLYVPADQMGRVHAYVGSDEENVRVNKMGGKEWDRAKKRAASGVKKLAQDLVAIYTERQAQRGYAFSADTPYQAEFEAAFQFDETLGQEQSIEEIKRDMESPRIMDRLLCGDVGYGKTEVAMRAAFKCTMDAKQVMFLVPTTILAQQHFTTMTARFDGFPVEIEMLSRFKTRKEEQAILKRFQEGKIDILVGTHKLLNKSVKPHDLGLLIVDEEQRFGVGHKETIQDIKRTVDVLTLTATPIPRTLEMSLVGIRDLSIIHTPPEQRLPINTYVSEYSDDLLKEALLQEYARGGQSYIVYNRVMTMERFVERVQALVPDAKITMAHGQMNERTLENAMLSFYSGEYDILVCSTIIENGLDISSANTMVIYDADRLGLAQLYQLRGRVGRSERSAYCYFTYRPERAISEKAQRRLSAIEEFTDLGSGFKIALRDLEIRGAGNVLGPEQHGHLQQVGYDTYRKLLDEAVKEAKGEHVEEKIECTIDTDLPAFIPSSYMESTIDKVQAYSKIANIETQKDAENMLQELKDRYGTVPKEVERLMDVSMLRSLAENVGIISITSRNGVGRIGFSERANVDLADLMLAIEKAGKGSSLLPGTPPSVMIRKNNISSVQLFTLLYEFVQTLQGEVYD